MRVGCLTCVFDGEVRFVLHVGGELVDPQGQLSFEGRGLLAERREASERALPGQSLDGGVPAGDGLGAQHGHREGRGRRGRLASSCLGC